MGYLWQQVRWHALRVMGLGCWLVAQHGGWAAPSPDRFHASQRTTANGLPQNTVLAVAQTTDGFLWMGTFRGLASHDGFEILQPSSADPRWDPATSINALAAHRQEGLWMATAKGLYWMDRHGASPVREPVTNAAFRAVAVLGDDVLAGGEWGVAVGRRGSMRILPNSPWIYSAAIAGTGRAWIAGRKGIFQMSAPLASNAPVLVEPATDHSAVVCSGPTVWASVDADLLEIDEPTARIRRRWSGVGVRPLLVDRAGNLWVSRKIHESPALGLATFDFETGVVRPYPLPALPEHEEIMCGMEDASGSLWFGTLSSGVVCLRPARVEVFGMAHGLPGEDVWSVSSARDGGLWILTRSGPARRVGSGFEATPWHANQWVGESILALGQHEAMAATIALVWFHPDAWGTEPGFRSRPRFVTVDRAGRRVAGGDHGILTQVGDGPWQPVPGLPRAEWLGWELGPDGEAFAGSKNHGLWHQLPGGPWRRAPLGDSVNAAAVLWWEDGRWPWVGSDMGLFRRHERGQWDHWTTRDGLLEDLVLAIEPDRHGHLFLLGHLGISRVAIADLKAIANGGAAREATPGQPAAPPRLRVRRIGNEDGMVSTEGNNGFPASTREPDGTLWFATTRGAVRLRPDALMNGAMSPPKPHVLGVREMSMGPGAPWLHPGSNHVFKAGSGRSLAIRFTAPIPTGGDRVRFECQLDPIDRSMRYLGQVREAQYPALPPGTYQFKVAATVEDQPYTPSVALWTFEVQPLWWERTSVRAAAGLLAVAGATGLLARRRRLQRHIASLERAHAVEDERRRLARDLHDGLGSEIARLNVAASTGHVDLGSVSRDLLRRLQTLVWLTDPGEDRLDALCRALAARVERFFPQGLPAVRVELPPAPDPRPIDGPWRREITTWLDEGLANIAKHSAAREVRLRIESRPDALHLVLSDDGRGFDPAHVHAGGRGLINLRSRIAALGGRMDLRSAPGSGTDIEAWIPLPQSHAVPAPTRRPPD